VTLSSLFSFSVLLPFPDISVIWWRVFPLSALPTRAWDVFLVSRTVALSSSRTDNFDIVGRISLIVRLPSVSLVFVVIDLAVLAVLVLAVLVLESRQTNGRSGNPKSSFHALSEALGLVRVLILLAASWFLAILPDWFLPAAAAVVLVVVTLSEALGLVLVLILFAASEFLGILPDWFLPAAAVVMLVVVAIPAAAPIEAFI
jgi:preprotein translocase subunit SecG